MKLSDAEWQVMNALWECQPATVREVMDHLPADHGWAYTTVKTMLTRLAAKEAVRETKRGNTAVYEPLVSRATARRSALGALLNQAFGGTLEPLLHFLVAERQLTARQQRELAALLAEVDRRRAAESAKEE
jgi:predicted transcriptional regulator